MLTDDSTTDIFIAVELMYTDTVASSIDDGADVNVLNSEGYTSLIATFLPHIDCQTD